MAFELAGLVEGHRLPVASGRNPKMRLVQGREALNLLRRKVVEAHPRIIVDSRFDKKQTIFHDRPRAPIQWMDRRINQCLTTARCRHLPDLRRAELLLHIEEIFAVKRFFGGKTSRASYLHRRPAPCRNLPDLPFARSIGAEINPLAIIRPAGSTVAEAILN